MALKQLTQSSSLYNIYTSAQKVLDYTPDTSNPRYCKIDLQVGDGSNGLNSSGNLSLEIKINSISHDGGAQTKTIVSSTMRCQSNELLIPANTDVEVYVQSDNSSDGNVRVIATLYDIPTGNVIEIGGDSQSLTDLKDFADTGYDPSVHKINNVKVADNMRGTDGAYTGTPPTVVQIRQEMDSNSTKLANLNATISSRSSHSANDVTGGTTVAQAEANIRGADSDTLKTISDALDTADNNVDTLLTRLTASRAGYLDNLNVGGLVASASDISAITQAQRVRVIPPPMIERPDSGSTTYRIWIYAYDETHSAEDLDAAPTVTVENNAGTDRSANLGTVTKPAATTGQYYVDYTVADSHAIEGLVVKVDATEGGNTTQYAAACLVVDTTSVDFTATDRAKIEAIYDKLPSKSFLTGSADSDGGIDATEAAVVRTQADAAVAVLNDFDPTTQTVTLADGGLTEAKIGDNAITAAKIASDAITQGSIATGAIGASELAESALNAIADAIFDELLTGHTTADSLGKAITDIIAHLVAMKGATFSELTDSLEAIRDRGDTAWITGSGGDGSTSPISPILAVIRRKAVEPTDIDVVQYSSTNIVIYIYDDTKTPVVMTGKTLRLDIGRPGENAIASFGSDVITVDPVETHKVTIAVDSTATQTADFYLYTLWEVAESPADDFAYANAGFNVIKSARAAT